MWSQADETHLIATLDQLIPPNPEKSIPGAGELGILDYLAKVASNDPSFEESVTSLLRFAQTSADGVTTDLVRLFEAEHPEAFSAILTETYKGYYSRPDMRAKVGVGAHPVHPKGYDVPPDPPQLMDELTAPVRARGPVFRDPTGGQK